TRLLLCLPAPISRQLNEPEAISPVTDHRRRQSHYSKTANWFTCLNDVRSKAATHTRLPENSRRRSRNIATDDADEYGFRSVIHPCYLWLPAQHPNDLRMQQHHIRRLLQRKEVVLLKLGSGFGRSQ